MVGDGTPRSIAIVGAGIAGASAVEALRRAGYDGRLVIIGDEPELPYERPPLSKGYLLGTIPEERVHLRNAAYYAEQGVELRLNVRARTLDVNGRAIVLEGGERVLFDRLLIATGGVARRLVVPGAELPGILYLRTLADARALKRALQSVAGGRIVVVGAGFIGCELAAVSRELGLEVTLLEALAVPLERAVGAEIGGIYAQVHQSHGVDLHMGEGVAAFHGSQHVEEVVTVRGMRIPCTCVVVGVGMRPADDWLVGTGLARENGVLVDMRCETSVAGIYAVGDVARWPYRPAGTEEQSELVRLEHFDTALRQGQCAARNMLGDTLPFTAVPYFWSDQYDLKSQYVGYARIWDHIVVRGNPAAGDGVAFYLEGGRVRAALAVNRMHNLGALRRLIGAVVEPAVLVDESTDLRALAVRGPVAGQQF